MWQRRSAQAGRRVGQAVDTALRLLPMIFSFQEGTVPAGKGIPCGFFIGKRGSI